MKTLKFSTTIDASAKKVWHILWDDATYSQWTKVFAEGSFAESDWNEGSPIKFLMPSGDGMSSKIETKVQDKKMVFRHLGSIIDGKEIPSPELEGSREVYTLEENNGTTILNTSVESAEKYVDFFRRAFPKALEKIKDLSEKSIN